MTGSARPIRVGLVDDHAVVRDGTALLLAQEPDLLVVGTAADLGMADDLLRLEPDVLVVDIRLGSDNGLALLHRISDSGGPAVVILTAFDYPQFVDAALRMGASGYVLKTDPIEDLVRAIRQVAAGGMAFTVRTQRSARRQFSPREAEIVRHVVEGESNDEIGVRLGISARTVEGHLTRIFEHVGVLSRTELATRAIREGWLETMDQ